MELHLSGPLEFCPGLDGDWMLEVWGPSTWVEIVKYVESNESGRIMPTLPKSSVDELIRLAPNPDRTRMEGTGYPNKERYEWGWFARECFREKLEEGSSDEEL